MKLTILALAALFASSGAIAAPNLKTCQQLEDMANTVMTTRQAGVPMAEAYKAVDGEDAVSGVYRTLILEAYKVSHYSLPENRARAVVDFRDKIFSSCMSRS
jgi:serine/threonine-protein kinase RIO1